MCTSGRRRLPETEKPLTCAVVIAWVNPYPLLQPGLRALLANLRQPDEIIVVTRHGSVLQQQFRHDFPRVNLISQPSDTTIPVLRSVGIAASSSSVVLVTEDHCTPAPDWVERAVHSISAGAGLASGPVENACTRRLRDWAAFLTEYSSVLRPAAPGVANDIPGNNVAYSRDVADEIGRTLAGGLWESFALPSLTARGVRFTFDPDMLVYHARPFDFSYFVFQRYFFCRSYAGMRLQAFGDRARWIYAAGSAALPLLLLWRSFRNLRARRRLIGRFLICSPLIALYFVAGAWGEMAGYAFGSTDSLRQVE